MTETTADRLQPAIAQTPSNKQRLFLRYFTAILIDLVVLNLFIEHTDLVVADTFTITLAAALLLQLLLKLTLMLEHRAADYFNAKSGRFAKFMRFFTAWLILFGSKFVILEVLDFALGTSLSFAGPFQGVVALIGVIIAMLLAEEMVLRFYRSLA